MVEEESSRTKSQSLWNRAVSYDTSVNMGTVTAPWSQSLWNRAVSYDRCHRGKSHSLPSQSLWNRAVSYDVSLVRVVQVVKVSIPLEQGSVLRP